MQGKELKGIRVLVTGGAGYIGSHTCYALLAAGNQVAVIDNLSTGFRGALHPEVHFWQADIRDRSSIERILCVEKPEVVIHFAASSQVEESMRKPLVYYNNNVEGTRILLDTLLDCGINKIVFSSSAAVYGEPDQIPLSEQAALKPTSVYGETKRVVEDMMGWCSRTRGLQYVALRYFNACGAHSSGLIGESHYPESHLIPLVFQTALGQRPWINIYGKDYPTPDGTCIRDYIHVMDLADAHILSAAYLLEERESMVFNLGSDLGNSVKEVIDAAERVAQRPIRVEYAPRRPGDPARLVASSSRARETLGWEPAQSDLQTVLSSAWEWHRLHPQGYGRPSL